VSRVYRPADFDAFLRKHSSSSCSRQYENEERAQTDWGSRGSSSAERQDRGVSPFHRDDSDRFRTTYRCPNREYSLRESKIQTLIEVGKFRVVPADDLTRLGYKSDRSWMENDIQNLRRQGLIEQRHIEGHRSYSERVLALIKEGHKLLARENLIRKGQTNYHGLVKPKEVRHDADLCRPYHQVANEIRGSGGKVRRVGLDYELKQELYRKLSRIDPQKDPAYEPMKIANELDLTVANDKIPVPDFRIEYEDKCREICCLDLEIDTQHYRPQGLAEKAKAGFHLFARQQDRPKLRRVLDQRELTAGILSL
jgi:hypothetical protein